MSAAVGAVSSGRVGLMDAATAWARRNTWTLGLVVLLAAILLLTRLIQPNYAAPQIQGLAISVLPIALAAVAQGIVVISGGVSAGKFDFVPSVLKDLGVETHFHKINLKPGKPLLFGTREGKLVFGLPGNPVSSFVGFELFVRPDVQNGRACGSGADLRADAAGS